MSECGVCIGGDDYDCELEFYDIKWPKAKKEHRCCECRRIITVGEEYEKWTGKWDGSLSSTKTCLLCTEIREGFSCGNTTIFGELWSEMRDYVLPVINSACFEKIGSVEARAFLQSKWMEWKFSDNQKYQAHMKAKSMIARAKKEMGMND
jgi:hypothetical protein